MFAKLYKPIAVVVVALLLLPMLVTPVVAAPAMPANTREAAGAPMPGWVSIAPNATHWFMFKYHYNNQGKAKDNDPTQAVVTLKMDKAGTVGFIVQDPASLLWPKYDADKHLRGPLGVGSPITYQPHEHATSAEQYSLDKAAANEHGLVVVGQVLRWAGAARASDTYYVIVKNNTNAPQAYSLVITGPDVSF
jgi:hypothetical protein